MRHKLFRNDAAGHRALLEWLGAQGVEGVEGVERAHACLEATGTWAEAVAMVLHEAGHVVSCWLVNPV